MKRELKEIKLGEIVLNKDNTRKNIEKSPSFPEFVESIKAGGIRVPVLVRTCPDESGKYQLVYGERRFRGCSAAGLKTIPAINVDSMSDEELYDFMYIENKFREDLKPLEEAAEVALLMERFGDAKAVAKKIRQNAQWVYVRANIAKGLIKLWRSAIEGDERFARWTLSHLLLIARLPEHIQKELHKYYVIDALRNTEISASDLEEVIGNSLHLLSRAKWGLDDETLVPKAGACSKCPKRSGHQPMLWFDSDDQVDAGDQCLDGYCWQSKKAAWLQRRARELKDKHPGLVFICKDHPDRSEAELVQQAVGSYLDKWNYKTCSKTTKGAKPAMYVHGKAAGKLTYIKLESSRDQSSAGPRPKGTPTPLKERRQALDAKRWSQVLLDLREKVKESTIESVTYPDKVTAVMALAAAYGNKNLLDPWQYRGHTADEEKPKTSEKEIEKLVKSKTTLSKARALKLLWQSFLPTLDSLLTYNGPITQTPKKHQDDAAWIAEMIGVDIKLLFEDVSQRKGFTEPKSWAGLNADGTPKKAKPEKKATKTKKTKAGKKAQAKQEKGKCRICACTDENACLDEETGEPCRWAEDDLCSSCHENLIISDKKNTARC